MDLTFGEPVKPCGDCMDGRCTMNCSTPMKPGTLFPSTGDVTALGKEYLERRVASMREVIDKGQFEPRHISRDMAAQGYNKEGRGKLIGYLAQPGQHERSCRYRISTRGNPDRRDHDTCTCRLGLWQETPPSEQVVEQMRATSKQRVKNKPGHWLVTPRRGKNREFKTTETMVGYISKNVGCIVTWIKQ